MKSAPTILAILALPAGAIGYVVTVNVLSALPLPEGAQGILSLVLPLFVAGLCMLPFLVPFFDRMAKRDLAAHARDQADAADPEADPPAEPRA
jgi:hypothetical protein